MAACRAARRCSAALALSLCAGVAAIRQQPEPHLCSGLLAKNRSVTFPLPVDGLLETCGQDKIRYFRYLRDVGLDGGGVEMRVPQKLPATCLGDAHFVFVGDCFARMSFEAFVRLGGHNVSAEEMAELQSLEDGGSGHLRLRSKSRLRRTASGSYFAQDSKALATYLLFLAKRPKTIERDLRELVEHIQASTPGVKMVFWMDALLHGWGVGESGWTDSVRRREWQIELLSLARSLAPDSLFIWDSPPFVDMPLMKARPPNPNSRVFEMAEVPRVAASLVDRDRQVMARLGAPVTLRWEISSRYRGLTCDGLHAYRHLDEEIQGNAWNCTGFPAYEDLVLQSGLQQLCSQRPAAPLCP